MKTRQEVQRRLRKLQVRYARKYVARSQERSPCNCVYNEEVLPGRLDSRPPVPVEEEMAPRAQVTLMVVSDPKPVRLCMYGADKAGGWGGDVCDDDDTARRCPYFRPSRDVAAARSEFMESLADDEHVFNHYRDMATLQWVLGERAHTYPLTAWHRFLMVLHAIVARMLGRLRIAPRPDPKIPDNLWDDNDTSPPAGS